MRKLIPLIALAALVPLFALAHGNEISLKKVVGNYETRLEYDSIGNPQAGEATNFNFELSNAPSGSDAKFDRVFVTVSEEAGPIVFLANVSALNVENIQTSRARVYLPQAGNYNFKLEYYSGDTKLVENTFSVQADPAYVAPGSSTASSTHKTAWPWLTLLPALIIGFAAGLLIGKKG